MSLSLAVCGLGSAGRSRVKAIENTPRVRLAGIVSRRPGVGTRSFEDVLQDPTIDAIAVSTENTDHPARVKAILSAGKHALCDYPLAFDLTTAQGLFDLARNQGVVLHVEHIGLLTQLHRNTRQNIDSLGALVSGSYAFEGGWNDKLADPSISGPPLFLPVSRLLQVADLLGSFSITHHSVKNHSDGIEIRLTIRFPSGALFSFSETRRMGLTRRRFFDAVFERGNISWGAEPKSENLFKKDLEFFLDRIDKKAPCYFDEGVMLRIIGELEHLGRGS